jgi:hypothetical protein
MIFNFFKNKDKEYAEQTYSMFAPPIKFAKEYGDWKKSSKTFGELFIDDKYLLGFFNIFISFTGKKVFNITSPKQSGLLMMECYKKMDGTFVLDEKVQLMTDIYQSLIGASNKDFEQAINDASLVFHVLCFPDSQDTYSDNVIFKEAKKFINSKEHQSEKNLQQKLFEGFPKTYYAKQPENALIAYRIFQNTFLKRLNKTFKVNE